jgi:maltooligosyltrehalose trehalohydrolase
MSAPPPQSSSVAPAPPAAQPRWRPRFGAWPDGSRWRFRVWAPDARRVELVLDDGAGRDLAREPDGCFSGAVAGLRAGDRYRYRIDGRGPFPDPASRSQPDGVHGPSQLVDPRAYRWRDARWRSPALEDAVIYELHAGTFSPSGTFAGAAARLPALADLGVTVVELMPVAAFPGARNWGYDGVALFAPASAYGPPDALRGFVDAAHGLGIAVLLDVVYNHFGPDGAYHTAFSPAFAAAVPGPWGHVPNLREAGHDQVRAFFVDNALHWLHEYHLDGLRIDATHAFVDAGAPPFLDALVAAVRARAARRLLLVAEDDRNERRLIDRPAAGGAGLDAVWADDLHHQLRVAVTGERESYYASYDGTTAAIADTISQGWFFRGAHSVHHQHARGTPTDGLPLARFVVCLQNHDQIGNRPRGDRLHHAIDLDVWRALTVLLLALPETPLLFMGQEWAATTPFLYFTDHAGALGEAVDRGRQAEFAGFSGFHAGPGAVPPPQALETFLHSRLDWRERDRDPHAGIWRLTRRAIALRRELAPSRRDRRDIVARALDDDTVAVEAGGPGPPYWCVTRLRGSGTVLFPPNGRRNGGTGARRDAGPHPAAGARVALTTEDPRDRGAPSPVAIDVDGSGCRLRFSRPGAVVLVGDR